MPCQKISVMDSEEICSKFSRGVNQVKHSNLEGTSRKNFVMLGEDFGLWGVGVIKLNSLKKENL